MKEQTYRVFEAIKLDPLASQQSLADRLDMSRESVAGHIMQLTRQGYILGKGYLLAEQNTYVVIGGANVDINGHSGTSLALHDSNPGTITQSPGGVGRNIAENLARLGEHVHLIAPIGVDQRGDWLIEKTRLSGVETHNVLRHDTLPTGTYLAISNDCGELQAAIADMRIIDSLDEHKLSTKQALLQSAYSIVVDANLTVKSIEWLAQQPLEALFIADAVSTAKAPRLRSILPKLSLLKVNQDEARAILDSNEEIPEKLAEALLAKGVKEVLLSLGSQGVLFANAENSQRKACHPTLPVSDTGAGDALLAGYLSACQQNKKLDQALSFALACAAMTLESAHANHPELTVQHVTQWIENL
ncbi:carbohydrate kinase [Marinomonas colpomeniae]|uniref:Winged helix-turn-helix transcriptional regulator n=1 Tax=Marinomonas colpomeniae TaxID=2774408 RepID=A0ABR8P2G3_9GAMM|nr:PfkB family carbohydrate kinase [Marinomonas colpomeniae]MBD5772451.1 winged helix-turn-helix transcriptional regulator [Marinomonas colpomeniae]